MSRSRQCWRSGGAGSSIRLGRCEQFAASLRQVAIVLPGEREKNKMRRAGVGEGCGGGVKENGGELQNMTGELQRHSSEVKKENLPGFTGGEFRLR